MTCHSMTPYQRLMKNLSSDETWQREITLGRRIGFYRFKGDAGTGNFSHVKIGVHCLTKEKVAVKILDKSKLDSKTQRMLSREISSMEKLHHPNLVRLFEVIETFSRVYLVMEYAPAGELFQRISTEGKLTEEVAKPLFAQIISAIDHMHQHHIIHRDIKAENVFFSDSKSIKVGDFGFSTQITLKTDLLSTFCGSPPYAAPELFSDESYEGPFVDLWSLGVLLYFMVTGSMPFRAQTVASLKKLILDGEYIMPEHLSYDVTRVIRGLLQHEPKCRLSLPDLKSTCWLQGSHFPSSLPKYKASQGIKADLTVPSITSPTKGSTFPSPPITQPIVSTFYPTPCNLVTGPGRPITTTIIPNITIPMTSSLLDPTSHHNNGNPHSNPHHATCPPSCHPHSHHSSCHHHPIGGGHSSLHHTLHHGSHQSHPPLQHHPHLHSHQHHTTLPVVSTSTGSGSGSGGGNTTSSSGHGTHSVAVTSAPAPGGNDPLHMSDFTTVHFEPSIPPLLPSQLSRDEQEAYEILFQMGINEELLAQSRGKGVRSNIMGTFRIVLHRIVTRRFLQQAEQEAINASSQRKGRLDKRDTDNSVEDPSPDGNSPHGRNNNDHKGRSAGTGGTTASGGKRKDPMEKRIFVDSEGFVITEAARDIHCGDKGTKDKDTMPLSIGKDWLHRPSLGGILSSVGSDITPPPKSGCKLLPDLSSPDHHPHHHHRRDEDNEVLSVPVRPVRVDSSEWNGCFPPSTSDDYHHHHHNHHQSSDQHSHHQNRDLNIHPNGDRRLMKRNVRSKQLFTCAIY